MGENKEIEHRYLRLDLQESKECRTTYYRLDKELVEFLNLIEKNGEQIIGIELERKEDNSLGYYMGFMVSNIKQSKDNG